jgi:Tfp pilus assembly protein PilE
MTDGLERIDEAFEEFRFLVEHCRNEAKSDMADIRDAYERFYRLRERYEHEDEARTLSQTEEAALRKVFREDKFIERVGRVRGVSAHVETGDVELLDPDKVGFTLTAKSSAAAMFAERCAHLTDKQGQIQRLNHLKWLTEAEARIARAIANAREGRSQ